MHCLFCNQQLADEKIHFRDQCPACSRDLHICAACFFYDPAAHNQCRESSAERVTDKERANFCDYFRPGTTPANTPHAAAAAARDALEDLFR